jgi:hypothetical protein
MKNKSTVLNIEIHTPGAKVKEWVTSYVRDKMLELHRKNKNISKARVYFWQQAKTQNGDKACEIDLTIHGDSLFVYRKAYSYEKAVREVLDELTQKVETKIHT